MLSIQDQKEGVDEFQKPANVHADVSSPGAK
jgi:hypothetical protein